MRPSCPSRHLTTAATAPARDVPYGRGAIPTWAVAGALATLLLATPVAAQGVGPSSASTRDDRCLTCHALPNLGYRDADGLALSFTVSPQALRASAHARIPCRDCHADVGDFPHAAASVRAPVSCAQDCHATDESGQPYSHAPIVRDFASSAHHNPDDPDSPTCLACHGNGDPHAIPANPVAAPATAKIATCARCHDDRAMMARHDVTPEAVASYQRSFHYKAIRFGDLRTAACSDCHTAHRVLPARDTASTVAAGHLTETCGQAQCHAGARRNFAISGANHLDLRIEQSPLLFVEERFFLVLTAGTMAMLVVGIVLDIQRKFGWIALVRRLTHRVARAGASSVRRTLPLLVRAGRRGLRVARLLLLD